MLYALQYLESKTASATIEWQLGDGHGSGTAFYLHLIPHIENIYRDLIATVVCAFAVRMQQPALLNPIDWGDIQGAIFPARVS